MILRLGSLILLASAGWAYAQAAPAPTSRPVPATQVATTTTRAATLPSTRPGESLESPRDALKWLAAALRDGNVDRLRKVILINTDAEDHMVAAMGDMARALAGLHASALKAFGPEAAGLFTDDTQANFEQTLARIDAADVSLAGDAATVRYAESKDVAYQLRKVAGQWRVPVTQFSQGVSAEVLDRRLAELVVQTRIVNDLATEMNGGKYKNADAASQAWRSKMMSALGGGVPTTKPATKGS